jgi:hypothetical protein
MTSEHLHLEKNRVVETALDIAYVAGAGHYHTDSREDIDTFIRLANEFETHREVDGDGNETYFGEEYLGAVWMFAQKRLFGAV